MTGTEARERVLLVDDDDDLRRVLLLTLRDAGFEADGVPSGRAALAIAPKLRPTVVLLDLILPDMPGIDVCRAIRASEEIGDAAILILTARSDEDDRVLGFEVGADDYVVKPFSVRELMLRVKVLARRAIERRHARASATPKSSTWRGLTLDPAGPRLMVDGVEMSLRPLELKLVALFLANPGRVFSRAELLEGVWGVTDDEGTRTVDTHVKRLRERLGVYGEAIETILGFGYRLRNEAE